MVTNSAGKHPAQNGDKLRPADLPAHAKAAVGIAGDQAVVPGLVDDILRPGALGIRIGQGTDRGHGRQQQGADESGTQSTFDCAHGNLQSVFRYNMCMGACPNAIVANEQGKYNGKLPDKIFEKG